MRIRLSTNGTIVSGATPTRALGQEADGTPLRSTQGCTFYDTSVRNPFHGFPRWTNPASAVHKELRPPMDIHLVAGLLTHTLTPFVE